MIQNSEDEVHVKCNYGEYIMRKDFLMRLRKRDGVFIIWHLFGDITFAPEILEIS